MRILLSYQTCPSLVVDVCFCKYFFSGSSKTITSGALRTFPEGIVLMNKQTYEFIDKMTFPNIFFSFITSIASFASSNLNSLYKCVWSFFCSYNSQSDSTHYILIISQSIQYSLNHLWTILQITTQINTHCANILDK